MLLIKLLTIFLSISFISALYDVNYTPILGNKEENKCYDRFNIPQKCIPEFENVAFNRLMEVTNTCGENDVQEYCVQTDIGTYSKTHYCSVCNRGEHHAKFLTDIHNLDHLTWWQSETMLDGIQWPNQVNLTIKFGKAFDITFVRLWFASPRPESFYISKKTSKEGEWIPYQYYSATCRDTYGLPDSTHTKRGEETRALCTSEYSDISPLSDGNIAFGTLEGRPSAFHFDTSSELQEWVTATEIMITLDRLNTFGDESFGDPRVLRSYFYAIADVAVGARCKCNGHAAECPSSVVRRRTKNGDNNTKIRTCLCQHNTAGADCGECLPFYNDAPWARATIQNAHSCRKCNCNGFSTRCMFDEKLYQETGHGGHCLDCSANRDGPNCERCRPNYFIQENGHCTACECNEIGSIFLQCTSEGKCQCKSGVIGKRCNKCAENYYGLSKSGCKSCNCLPEGSLLNKPNCNSETGQCACKENVEGTQCRECKPGFFNLIANNEFGCMPCFCYGHSSQCKSALGYFSYAIESTFAKGAEKWKVGNEFSDHQYNSVNYEPIHQCIAIQQSSNNEESLYFIAPERFLGDQKASYNQNLEFVLRIGQNDLNGRGPIPTATDIILEGANNLTITNTIFAQHNKLPSHVKQNYKFRLHEHSSYGWQPHFNSRTFISLLSNLTAIKIKGTYSTPKGIGFLEEFRLESASRDISGNHPALWIELCQCPSGYVGQHCESCAPGYRHLLLPSSSSSSSYSVVNPFMNCIPCNCNNHATICDSENGHCICQHNTWGENCQFCAKGFYGNAEAGTGAADCQPCNCPQGGTCIQLEDDGIMCTQCPVGRTGRKCEICADGYFKEPTDDDNDDCKKCDCNQNIDLNAMGNCNRTTGACLKCIFNTGGSKCEFCLPGYYGNALVLPKGDCKKCECNLLGTLDAVLGEPSICDQSTGSCRCRTHIVGRNCDQCENGYYNFVSGQGCTNCNCDPIGSLNFTCDLNSGQCYCRPGVTGLRCDHCEARKFGFSLNGCEQCECDKIGSQDLQCDLKGQCPCLENVNGRKCDRCKENKYNRHKGCIDCPECYKLVQDAQRNHTSKIHVLTKILTEIEEISYVIDDEEFGEELLKLETEIDQFYSNVKNASAENGVYVQFHEIQHRQKEISRALEDLNENVFTASEKSKNAERNLDKSEEFIMEIEEQFLKIEDDVQVQGKRSFQAALERSRTAGQQSEKMAKIAQESRKLADQFENKATVLVSEAEEAKKKSIEIYDLVKNTRVIQQNISDAARKLRTQVQSAEMKLHSTAEWTKNVNEEVKKTKNEAVSLLNDLNNLIVLRSRLDLPELNIKSSVLKYEADRLKNRVKSLLEKAKNLNIVLKNREYSGKDLLETAAEFQEELEILKNDVDLCNFQVNESINLWNEILKRAETNFQLISEYDNQTRKSKENAEKSLKEIPQIYATLQETERKTDESKEILNGALKKAELAETKAINAEKLAKDATEKTERIKSEADDLNKSAYFLVNEAAYMYDRVVNTEAELKNLYEKVRLNNTLVYNVKEKVGRAGRDTEAIQNHVTELLKDVDRIMQELDNTPDISEEQITKLEEETRITEEKLKATKLEERLAQLQRKHKIQNEQISNYKEQIKKLEQDVNNIELIVNSLPNECFKKLELEP